jgi:ketosteroid isomerase-like protein
MEDDRVWSFEKSLWTGDAEHYRHLIDEDCVMVVPTSPFVLQGNDAIDAVAKTPRWGEVDFSDGHIVRPQEGLIVVAYKAQAHRDGNDYEAHCTSTYRRLGHDEWRVVQHQQTPPLRTTMEEDAS